VPEIHEVVFSATVEEGVGTFFTQEQRLKLRTRPDSIPSLFKWRERKDLVQLQVRKI
jgi:hypothetical protein